MLAVAVVVQAGNLQSKKLKFLSGNCCELKINIL